MTESMPIVNQAAVTMSSREIAELVGSNHSDVKRSARRLADDGILTQPLAEFPFEHNGNTYMEMRFNKRDSLVLVARLSPQFTAAVVDRWQQLEAQQQPAIPQSYAAALLEAGRLAMELEQAQQQLQEAAPAVAFMDRYVEAKSTKAIREVAKVLGIRERQFIEYLEQNRIMYRIGRDLVPYAQYQHRGLFEVKTGETHGHAWQQTRFTPEGVAWIASRITKELGGVA
jgi:phage antirepressor YoqD-like protein